MKVRFTPVVEQYAYMTEAIQEKNGVPQSFWSKLVIYYCVLNLYLVPAILLYFEYYLFAGITFALTLAVSVAYRPLVQSRAYVDYYRRALADQEEIEVELDVRGIRMECDDCTSFFKWSNICAVQNDKLAIYLMMKECGIAIPKTAFSSPHAMADFMDFAESHAPKPSV
jgi:hypothetical protein